MNIMEIVSGQGVNGAIMHCLLLTRQLTHRGHRVTVVCHENSFIAKELTKETIPIIPSDLHRWPPNELRRISKIVREEKIDLIHTHMSRAHFFGVLLRLRTRIPCVATAHSAYIQLHWMFNNHIIAVSKDTARFHHLFNLISKKRMTIIPNFVDTDGWVFPDPSTRSATRHALGIGADTIVIGTTGHIIPEKGMGTLIKAFKIVQDQEPKTRLVIVGDGPQSYLSQLKSVALRLQIDKNIIWTGHRNDIPKLLTALDIFVSASFKETLGMSIQEAMARSLPVVATDVGGISDSVEHGITGLLVPPGNPNILADTILGLIRAPQIRSHFGNAAQQRIHKYFSARTQVPKIEDVFLTLLESNS